MPLPTSGQLSFSAIATELGLSLSNLSLRSMSNTAGFSTPDSMSEFYGYSNITYTPYDYLYDGDPCSSLYWLLYSGSDGKYYVNNGNYVLISSISGTWYQYSFYDDFMMTYVYNMYTSSNGNLVFSGISYSYCGPF